MPDGAPPQPASGPDRLAHARCGSRSAAQSGRQDPSLCLAGSAREGAAVGRCAVWSAMASLSLTQRWLADAAQRYPDPARVYADVDAVLAAVPTLRPKSDVYSASLPRRAGPADPPPPAFDDGRTLLLLCVHGLLPITFRNASYNIPVALWVTRDYPRQPPIAYVVPTADMLVRAGPHVDVSGRCTIDYAEHWARKHEVCLARWPCEPVLTER